VQTEEGEYEYGEEEYGEEADENEEGADTTKNLMGKSSKKSR
jgi:hypothetical protein